MLVKKQQLEPDMKQQTDSKLGKENIKAVYCHPAYLTSMQGTSCRIPGWMTGIKAAGRNINNLRYADDTTVMAESEEELQSLWMKVKEERGKEYVKAAYCHLAYLTYMQSTPCEKPGRMKQDLE